ncbi:MAG: hypothetical protein AVDCRST_MAG19-3310, partial [uncultured Thermomicrobiales bacterium]
GAGAAPASGPGRDRRSRPLERPASPPGGGQGFSTDGL